MSRIKAPQVNHPTVCHAKIDPETRWVDVYMPNGERIKGVRNVSLHQGIDDVSYVKLELFVKIEQE